MDNYLYVTTLLLYRGYEYPRYVSRDLPIWGMECGQVFQDKYSFNAREMAL